MRSVVVKGRVLHALKFASPGRRTATIKAQATPNHSPLCWQSFVFPFAFLFLIPRPEGGLRLRPPGFDAAGAARGAGSVPGRQGAADEVYAYDCL